MAASFVADQQKMSDFNKIRYSSNFVLRLMCRLHYYEALKLFSVYFIYLQRMPGQY